MPGAGACPPLGAPKAVWVMLPSGAPTETTLVELSGLLRSRDVVFDLVAVGGLDVPG